MADTAVAITAGTGTNIDTRTEATNGNHRQVIVIGDPSTNTGVAPVDATNGLSVTLTTALPAGTNAIGKLAGNSGVDIGDVDVTSIAAGDNNIGNVDVVTINGVAPAFGTGLRGATVQRVTIATDDSVPVTNAGITTIAGAVSGTEMQVDVLTMPTVTETNSSAIKTAVELIDDAIVADDAAFTPATTKVQMAGFQFDDVATDSVNEGDAGAARMSANRNIYTQIRDAAGNERGLNVDANGAIAATVTNATATNLKAQAEAYQGGTAVGAANPLQVSLANHGANGTAVKVNVASGGIASGAIASGAIASGAVASGAFASGALASGSIAAGAIATGATSIAANEDDASANLDTGVKVLAVRKATPANTSGLDGDYEFLQMSAGRVWTSATIDAALPAGTNNIGDVDVLTLPAIPTGSNTIGAVTNTALSDFGAGEYETVAASQTAQALGATGAAGDYIAGILVIPATTSPGNVLLLDNATSITVFTGGASSVSNLVPFFIPLGMKSVSGAWKITTGANVSCIGIGNFT